MADRGIKFAKDGFDITSTNIDDYNLWTKYPPLTFLEKKIVQITIDTTDGCPAVGTLTESVSYSYDFIPLVIARIEDDTLEEKYDLPINNLPIGGVSRCDGDHDLRVAFDYTIREGYVDVKYSAYCASLIEGVEDECISSNLVFNIYLYFYMWELGSMWPCVS